MKNGVLGDQIQMLVAGYVSYSCYGRTSSVVKHVVKFRNP